MINKWVINDSFDINEVNKIARELKLPISIVEILFKRNLKTVKDINDFLYPSIENLHNPFLMKGMKETTERIIKAIKENQKIMIFGDYDTDGITSTAMLYKFLKSLGNDPIFFIPNRVEDGYGLSLSGIDFGEKNKVNIIITVDCGTTAFHEIDYAK